MTMKRYAICNQKGGVGKSTTTYHLARAAFLAGRRVLVVDMDPQGNLTSMLAADSVEDDQVGVADALSSRSEEVLRDVLVPSIWAGVDVAPTSGETLGFVRDELVIAGAGRESRLGAALDGLVDDYDLIFIDCPPSLDQLTINALTGADCVLAITQSKLGSSNGLGRLLDTIESVKTHYNPSLIMGGIIINQHEENTVGGRYWSEQVADAANRRSLNLLSPPIPKRVAIADSSEAAYGLDEWPTQGSEALGRIYAKHLLTLEGIEA